MLEIVHAKPVKRMEWENVNPINALLKEDEGFAARFGCELVRDDYELHLLTNAGKNRGVRIEYGKNLEDVTAEIDVDNLVTRIIPVGETKAGDKLYLTDDENGVNWIDSQNIGNYAEPHVHILECSDCKVGSGGVTTALARTRMRAQAEKMYEDGCDAPAMKLTVNFVSLAGTDAYRDFAALEKVFLYDTVSIYHAHIGVTASAKVTRGVWNALLEKWDSMDLETSEFTTPAWEDGISLGEIRTAEKSNEITAIPQLLEMLDVEGAVITIDAMGCQKTIAEKIVDRKASYILSVKDNQPTIKEDISDYFKWAPTDKEEKRKLEEYEAREKGHGRIVTRRTVISHEVSWCTWRNDWKNLSTLVMMERTVWFRKRESVETMYYISDLAGNARAFGEMIRGHWSIENNLHWMLDVSMREDASLIHAGYAAENLSLIRKIALAYLKRDKTKKTGVKGKQKIAGWDNDFALSLIC